MPDVKPEFQRSLLTLKITSPKFSPFSGFTSETGEKMKFKKGMWAISLLMVMALIGTMFVPAMAVNEEEKDICPLCQAPKDSPDIPLPSDTNTNLLEEFGIEKPKKESILPKIKQYSESKDLIDNIIKKADITVNKDDIIGLYDMTEYQIVLIRQDDNILELICDGKIITSNVIIPELIGEKESLYSPVKVKSETTFSDNVTITTKTSTKLHSLSINLPGKASTTWTHLVKKSRTDEYQTPFVTVASLHTEGWFYVDYGNCISSIGDDSSSAVYWPGWQKCEYSESNTGAGTVFAQHNTHFKFGSTYQRGEMNIWVSCDSLLNADDGGNTNTWISGNGDGCTG